MSQPRPQKISLSQIRESISESIDDNYSHRLKLFIYLVPIVGFFPALWTLYRNRSSREERSVSRLIVILSLTWIIGVIILNSGAQAVDSAALPLMISSTLLTSGYFVTNLWLMIRLWQRKKLKLPVISRLGDRLP
ncbi:MAG: hypothetical protein AAFQ57_00350 [Cyanobacteria bacterium J06626_14]